MKYIDADKLIAEIEKRRLSNRYIDTEDYENELLEIIDSLQQEMELPEKYQTPNWLFEEQEQPIGEEYTIEVGKHTHTLRVGSQSDIDNLIRQEKQEQPEVDLWKEIHGYFNPHGMKLQFDRSKGNTILKPEQLINFARHFYAIGRAGTLALTADDVKAIFNKVREVQEKYSATEGCYQDVADWFNKQQR